MNPAHLRPIILAFCALLCATISSAAATGEIFSSAEATKLIGQPVKGPTVIGPLKDEDSPALATHWTYQAKESAVVVSRLDFASAAEARKYATLAFVKRQNEDNDAKITEEPGVGEKAFWSATEKGCALIFLKGSHLTSIGMGGQNIGSPESHKAALKAAAIALASKL